MDINNFEASIANLKEAIKNIKKQNIDLKKGTDKEKFLYDFKEKKLDYVLNSYKKAFEELKASSLELNYFIKFDKTNELVVVEIDNITKEIGKHYSENNLDKIDANLDEITGLTKKLHFPEEKPIEKLSFELKNNKIPATIKGEINADIKELEKCFKSGCYRSCVMLCGRLLETALHRKYFDVTKNDLLEKSPGIGLGKIIAKLDEKQIKLDPGLTQQIHLINQLRIFSVHKKQEAFNPTKQQAQAIILYTLDVLEKIF